MGNSLTNINLNDDDLYIALSEIFLGLGLNDDDFQSIAIRVKSFPLQKIKEVLFRYVSPACYYNTFIATPELDFFDDG